MTTRPQPKPKRGRPRLDVPRDKQVTAQLTAAEHARATELAREAGISVSEWTRIAVVGSLR